MPVKHQTVIWHNQRVNLMRFLPLLLGAAIVLFGGCISTTDMADLVVRDATVFDPHTGRAIPNQVVVIREGLIASVVPTGSETIPAAHHVIEAEGRLLIPGIIDVHHHTADVLADSSNGTGGTVASLSMKPDSVTAYRRTWAGTILPYGVTVVREAGGDDRYLPLMRAWMNPVPWAPDFYPSGGALVSHEEGRRPFAGHTVVVDSADAVRTVQTYHEAGFHYVKLYWRLRLPEFRAVLREAQTLGMLPYGHIDNKVVCIQTALELGLRHFEHVYTLAVDAASQEELEAAYERTVKTLGDPPPGAFLYWSMEVFNGFGDDNLRLLSLVEALTEAEATVTPTLHLFANPFGLSPIKTEAVDPAFAATSKWTNEQMARARHGYSRMAALVRRLHEAGVSLALGTDVAEPGRSALSEIILLNKAGIPIADTLRIATLGSAQALGLEEMYGTIEPGKRAHLVLFDESPLERIEAILGGKTVIKDGVVHVPKS